MRVDEFLERMAFSSGLSALSLFQSAQGRRLVRYVSGDGQLPFSVRHFLPVVFRITHLVPLAFISIMLLLLAAPVYAFAAALRRAGRPREAAAVAAAPPRIAAGGFSGAWRLLPSWPCTRNPPASTHTYTL